MWLLIAAFRNARLSSAASTKYTERLAPIKPHFQHLPTTTVALNGVKQRPDNAGHSAENASNYA
jgi:hypothetical protein